MHNGLNEIIDNHWNIEENMSNFVVSIVPAYGLAPWPLGDLHTHWWASIYDYGDGTRIVFNVWLQLQITKVSDCYGMSVMSSKYDP